MQSEVPCWHIQKPLIMFWVNTLVEQGQRDHNLITAFKGGKVNACLMYWKHFSTGKMINLPINNGMSVANKYIDLPYLPGNFVSQGLFHISKWATHGDAPLAGNKKILQYYYCNTVFPHPKNSHLSSITTFRRQCSQVVLGTGVVILRSQVKILYPATSWICSRLSWDQILGHAL